MTPALLMSVSSAGNWVSTLACSAAIAAGSLTSLLKVWMPGSARLAASSFSWSRPVTITVLPR